MLQSESITELCAALEAVQSALPTMPKSAQAYGYKYTDLDTIVDTIKPILHKNGVAYLQSVGGLSTDQMTLTTRIFHKSGEYIEDTAALPVIVSTKNNAAQTLGMSITYMRRYMLCAMLGITSDEDTDADGKSGGAHTGTPPAGDGRKPQGKKQEGSPKPPEKEAHEPENPYAFTKAEGEEMKRMFASGLFPDEEQDAIRESVRKRESTAGDVLWATRQKYAARAKAKLEKESEKRKNGEASEQAKIF